jgi:NitT/TauT family transport system substrate-binding protein
VATPALLSGTVDISTSSTSALSAIMRGAHLKIIYTMADHLPDQLWASRPDLKTLKDLKGLTVGIASRGDTYEIVLRSALEDAGLPQDWVGYAALGFEPSIRLSALISGSLPAVMITSVDSVSARASGSLDKSHLMINFLKMQIPYTGAAVSDQLLKSNPKMVEGFLRATIKGVRYTFVFEQQSVDALHKRNPQTDPKLLLQGYRDTIPTMTKVGTASDDVIQTDLKVRAAILNIDPSNIPPIADMYDYTLTRKVTDELDRSGWQPTP